MTLIPEETDTKKESDTERERAQNANKKRGEEVEAFVQKEITAIDQCTFITSLVSVRYRKVHVLHAVPHFVGLLF